MPSSLRRWSRRRAGVGQDLDAVLAIDWSDGADFGSMLWELGPHGTLDIDGEPVYHQHAPVETAPISPDKVTFAEEARRRCIGSSRSSSRHSQTSPPSPAWRSITSGAISSSGRDKQEILKFDGTHRKGMTLRVCLQLVIPHFWIGCRRLRQPQLSQSGSSERTLSK